MIRGDGLTAIETRAIQYKKGDLQKGAFHFS
jgi:hypothetical protein